jgi:MFS family permease
VVLFGLSTGTTILSFIRVATCDLTMCIGAFVTMSLATIGHVAPPEYIGSHMGFMNLLVSFSTLAGPLIAGGMSSRNILHSCTLTGFVSSVSLWHGIQRLCCACWIFWSIDDNR